jgi:hypothetical protein
VKASVLIIHSRYLSGAASGENRVVEDESRLLSEGGHHVDTGRRGTKKQARYAPG